MYMTIILNIFFPETAWSVKAKLQLEGEMKVCINGPGHMTKMAAMPIYGKSSPEPKVLGKHYKVCINNDPY